MRHYGIRRHADADDFRISEFSPSLMRMLIPRVAVVSRGCRNGRKVSQSLRAGGRGCGRSNETLRSEIQLDADLGQPAA